MEIRLVVVGIGSVGKSAITLRYITDRFMEDYDPSEYLKETASSSKKCAAVEDSYRKQTVIDGKSYRLDILDIAGCVEYSWSRDDYFRRGRGFALVFSLTDHRSFEELPSFHEHLLKVKDIHSMPMVLIGNKCDLVALREVTSVEARELAKKFNCCPYFETSAKTGQNVIECFESVVRCVQREDDESVQKNRTKKTTKGCSIV